MKTKAACLTAFFLYAITTHVPAQHTQNSSVAEAAILLPSAQDRADYADYLNATDRGLIRLLPRDSRSVTRRPAMRGGGSYYSFAKLTHEYGYGSDIELQDGSGFLVGFAGVDYGMIRPLGERPLEVITVGTPGVEDLALYEPPLTVMAARAEQTRVRDGYAVEGRIYRQRAGAVARQTYIIRSINYGVSDVLVALRVVREDADGSLTIAWRMLKKYKVPKLARQTDGG